MPLPSPQLDTRTYQDLVDEGLARIPVHTPEWTNFNESDPGRTLIEVFAFLTESLLYRVNQIPDRNRLKFLSLLGVQLQPASSAQGLVTFANERGPMQAITLTSDLEVRAGQIPFRTETGLAVLPVEAQAYYKASVPQPQQPLMDYYRQLYASYLQTVNTPPPTPVWYQTLPLTGQGTSGVDLGNDTVDNSLWIALLVRANDKPTDTSDAGWAAQRDAVRNQIAGKTLTLGIVPMLTDPTRTLAPGDQATAATLTLQFFMPKLPPGGALPSDPAARQPQYVALPPRRASDVLTQPGTVDLTLPVSVADLRLWANLDPLESGTGNFPPALDDTSLNQRLLTWVRITAPGGARLLWAGINAALVTQKAHVSNERLPDGTGEPDQVAVLARPSVLPASVTIQVSSDPSNPATALETWQEIDDLMTADPEVPTPDLRLPPGTPPQTNNANVFAVNAEAREIHFGTGLNGARPVRGALIYASYDYGQGRAGNVEVGAIGASPVLPPGFAVTNPVRTWGGADAETPTDGERQVPRYLQHRDRLVSATDFESIAWRTPGVAMGRVDVIPAFHPDLAPNEPGDAPGVVTLMLIPAYDPDHPDAPLPDQLFLDTVANYLCPRRLVTTELVLRPPTYVPIWVSVGLDIVAGFSAAVVQDAVKQALTQYLSPLPQAGSGVPDDQTALLTTPQAVTAQRGWPLRKAVVAQELLAVATRVPGVLYVNAVQLARDADPAAQHVSLSGLELPRLAGISVVAGDPLTLDQLRGATPTPPTAPHLPIPIIPDECR